MKRLALFLFLFIHRQELHAQTDSTLKTGVNTSFPGADSLCLHYLVKNFNNNVPADNFCPPGTYIVIVQFVVDKEGYASDVRALTSHGFGMEEEAMKVIRKRPAWKPFGQDSRQKGSYCKQAFTFHVTSNFMLSAYKLKAGEPTIIEIKELSKNIEPKYLKVKLSRGTIHKQQNLKYRVKVKHPGTVFFIARSTKKGKAELGKIALLVE